MAVRGGPLRSSSSAVGVPGWRTEDFLRFETDFLEEGVVAGVGSNLAVSQRGAGANMSVDVAAGRALIDCTSTLLSPNETFKTWLYSDAVVNVPITTADPTNPRKDRIVAKFDMTVDPNTVASNVVSITVVTGTPAGSPSAPSEPSSAITLAIVDVLAGATSITNARITDSRPFVTMDTGVLTELSRQGIRNSIAAGSGTNTVTASYTPTVTALADGMILGVVPANDNSGAVTFNADGTGAKAVKKYGATALASGDWKAKVLQLVQYNLADDNWKQISILGNGPPAASNYAKVLYLSAASSTTQTNPTSMTAFDTHTYAIPANDLVTGVGYEFEAAFTIAIGAGTLDLAIMLGSTQLANMRVNTASPGKAVMRGWIGGTAAAGASVPVRSMLVGGNDSGATGDQSGYAVANVATNGGLTLQLGAKFNTSNGGNSVICTMAKFTRVSTTAS